MQIISTQKEFGKDFEKNLGYRDLHSQSYKFMPSNVFRNFRNKCIKIFELNSANFFLHHQSQHCKHLCKRQKYR